MYRAVFRGTDRVKLTMMMLNRLILMRSLQKINVIDFIAPFHNYFTLHGEERFDISEFVNEEDEEETEPEDDATPKSSE